MARNPRDTVPYRLKVRRKTVRIGITNNPPRREAEHREDGLKFTKLQPVGPVVTRKTAEKKEQELLRNFTKNHGKLPKYNIDPKG